jgi:hypothetical protein
MNYVVFMLVMFIIPQNILANPFFLFNLDPLQVSVMEHLKEIVQILLNNKK